MSPSVDCCLTEVHHPRRLSAQCLMSSGSTHRRRRGRGCGRFADRVGDFHIDSQMLAHRLPSCTRPVGYRKRRAAQAHKIPRRETAAQRAPAASRGTVVAMSFGPHRALPRLACPDRSTQWVPSLPRRKALLRPKLPCIHIAADDGKLRARAPCRNDSQCTTRPAVGRQHRGAAIRRLAFVGAMFLAANTAKRPATSEKALARSARRALPQGPELDELFLALAQRPRRRQPSPSSR
jgi:hypothetical protein